jgi:hypothetical protein
MGEHVGAVEGFPGVLIGLKTMGPTCQQVSPLKYSVASLCLRSVPFLGVSGDAGGTVMIGVMFQ